MMEEQDPVVIMKDLVWTAVNIWRFIPGFLRLQWRRLKALIAGDRDHVEMLTKIIKIWVIMAILPSEQQEQMGAVIHAATEEAKRERGLLE